VEYKMNKLINVLSIVLIGLSIHATEVDLSAPVLPADMTERQAEGLFKMLPENSQKSEVISIGGALYVQRTLRSNSSVICQSIALDLDESNRYSCFVKKGSEEEILNYLDDNIHSFL
jgi:hypothetical protein